MKILIVGAGLSGSVMARELCEDHQVTVIDSRYHVAGNMYDYIEDGIRIHKYGPHIFHTNNEKVYDYLSNFTEWTEYQHKVKAILENGQYVTLPVNKETKEIVGEENVLDTFFRPYTRKMWGKELEELDPGILKRVPIRDDMNELYFPNDKFQAMPSDGYTNLIKNLLDHENIKLKLGLKFDKNTESDYDYVFNSMPIDEYFDFDLGELPYRSIKFKTVELPSPSILPVPCVNFTHNGPNTRMTEWKNFPACGSNPEKTFITYETPCSYEENHKERYYPVKDIDGLNNNLYKKYKEKTPDNMTFIGRCGTYQYLDMDACVSNALHTSKKFKETLC